MHSLLPGVPTECIETTIYLLNATRAMLEEHGKGFLTQGSRGFTNLLLLWVVIVDGTAVLSADISALPVLGGGIMTFEECIAECFIRNLLGVKCQLKRFCVASAA